MNEEKIKQIIHEYHVANGKRRLVTMSKSRRSAVARIAAKAKWKLYYEKYGRKARKKHEHLRNK